MSQRPLAAADPRVVASREAMFAIPWWRPVKKWRAMGRHIELLNAMIAERILEEHNTTRGGRG